MRALTLNVMTWPLLPTVDVLLSHTTALKKDLLPCDIRSFQDLGISVGVNKHYIDSDTGAQCLFNARCFHRLLHQFCLHRMFQHITALSDF